MTVVKYVLFERLIAILLIFLVKVSKGFVCAAPKWQCLASSSCARFASPSLVCFPFGLTPAHNFICLLHAQKIGGVRAVRARVSIPAYPCNHLRRSDTLPCGSPFSRSNPISQPCNCMHRTAQRHPYTRVRVYKQASVCLHPHWPNTLALPSRAKKRYLNTLFRDLSPPTEWQDDIPFSTGLEHARAQASHCLPVPSFLYTLGSALTCAWASDVPRRRPGWRLERDTVVACIHRDAPVSTVVTPPRGIIASVHICPLRPHLPLLPLLSRVLSAFAPLRSLTRLCCLCASPCAAIAPRENSNRKRSPPTPQLRVPASKSHGAKHCSPLCPLPFSLDSSFPATSPQLIHKAHARITACLGA